MDTNVYMRSFLFLLIVAVLSGCGTREIGPATPTPPAMEIGPQPALPTPTPTLREIALLLGDEGRDEEALQAFSDAIEYDPNDYVSLTNRTYYLLAAGNITDAIADCTRAAELNADYAPAFINCGYALAENGQIEKAIAYLDHAEILDSGNVVLYINRGSAYTKKGNDQRAIDDYTVALSIEPDNYDAITLRASSYLSLGQPENAIADLNTAIRIEPKDANNYLFKALLQREMLDLASARETLEAGLELSMDASMQADFERVLDEINAFLAEPDSATNQDADLCDWFIQTQILRSTRIAGLTSFAAWYQQYGEAGFTSTDPQVMAEFANVLRTIQPSLNQFATDWEALGAHPDSQEFWSKELESTTTRNDAFDFMITGLENDDRAIYARGILLFDLASQLGREAETAMLAIHEKCLP